MIHRLAHLFGLYHGQCYSWWDKERLMIGFKCNKCGDITGVHDVTDITDRQIEESDALEYDNLIKKSQGEL